MPIVGSWEKILEETCARKSIPVLLKQCDINNIRIKRTFRRCKKEVLLTDMLCICEFTVLKMQNLDVP